MKNTSITLGKRLEVLLILFFVVLAATCVVIAVLSNGRTSFAKESLVTPSEENVVADEESRIAYVNNTLLLAFFDGVDSPRIDEIIRESEYGMGSKSFSFQYRC